MISSLHGRSCSSDLAKYNRFPTWLHFHIRETCFAEARDKHYFFAQCHCWTAGTVLMLTIVPTVYQVQLQFPLASLNSMKQFSHNSLSYFCTQNYGEFFDEGPEGIAGGPVELIDSGNTTTDLSSNEWSYKVNYMEAASSYGFCARL